MLTLEQRVKRLEHLIRMNESDGDEQINLYRSVGEEKKVLIASYSLSELTPQKVISDIKEDIADADYESILDYISRHSFDFVYDLAEYDMEESYEGEGEYEEELDGLDCEYTLCSANSGSGYLICPVLTLYIHIDEGFYNDKVEAKLKYSSMWSDDYKIVGDKNDPAFKKIEEVVFEIFNKKM